MFEFWGSFFRSFLFSLCTLRIIFSRTIKITLSPPIEITINLFGDTYDFISGQSHLSHWFCHRLRLWLSLGLNKNRFWLFFLKGQVKFRYFMPSHMIDIPNWTIICELFAFEKETDIIWIPMGGDTCLCLLYRFFQLWVVVISIFYLPVWSVHLHHQDLLSFDPRLNYCWRISLAKLKFAGWMWWAWLNPK